MQQTFLPPAEGARPRGLLALVGDCLRRPGGRRALSALTVVLTLAGIGMFAYPVVTDVLAKDRQGGLQARFDDPGFREVYRQRKVKVGEGLTRLQIPKLGVDVLVVEGTTPAALRAGAGHYPGTPLPGERGNVGIAGHRTTYGRPFNRLDEMDPGDDVILTTPFARYTYRAVAPFGGHPNPFVVLPTDTSVVGQSGSLGTGRWLTLTTCTPKGSAAYRLILRLRLVKSQPLPATPATGR